MWSRRSGWRGKQRGTRVLCRTTLHARRTAVGMMIEPVAVVVNNHRDLPSSHSHSSLHTVHSLHRRRRQRRRRRGDIYSPTPVQHASPSLAHLLSPPAYTPYRYALLHPTPRQSRQADHQPFSRAIESTSKHKHRTGNDAHTTIIIHLATPTPSLSRPPHLIAHLKSAWTGPRLVRSSLPPMGLTGLTTPPPS